METAVPRRGMAHDSKNDESGSESDSNSGGSETDADSESSGETRWSRYSPKRPSTRFSQIDEEALDELHEEEARRQGLTKVDPRPVKRSVSFSVKPKTPPPSPTSQRRDVAERPDRFTIAGFFDNYQSLYEELIATIPRSEFFTPPPVTKRTWIDYFALINNGISPVNPVAYVSHGLAFPYHYYRRRKVNMDRSIAKWDEYPLSSRDVERWMSSDPEIRPLMRKFREKVGPIDGAELRSLKEGEGYMKLFDESTSEVQYRRRLLLSLEKMLTNEGELLAPFLHKAINVVVGFLVMRTSLLNKASMPLQAKGSDEQKARIVKKINKYLNAFVSNLDKALRRNHHQPLNAWAAQRGFMHFLTAQALTYIFWLTGRSSASVRQVLPQMKQLAYDKVLVAAP